MNSRSIAVALAATVALVACGGSSGTGGAKVSPPPSSDMFTSGTLTLGSDISYPPQEFFPTGSKEADGFDIDMAKKLASVMGLNFAVVNQNFDGIFTSLDAKHYDIVMSAVTVNDERKQKYQFVPYFSAGQQFVVAKGSTTLPTKLEDLCGLTVAVQKGTNEEDAAKGVKCARGKVGVNSYDLDTEALAQLTKGSVQVHFTDSPVAVYEVKNHANLQLSGSVLQSAPEGIVIRKNDNGMFDAMKAAFKQLEDDGTYDSLLSKWGLKDGDIRKVTTS